MQFGAYPSSNGPFEKRRRAAQAAALEQEQKKAEADRKRKIEHNDYVALKLRERRRKEQREETFNDAVIRIQREVARNHGLLEMDILTACRSAKVVAARHEAMFRAAAETTLSFPKLAVLFGGRDHTTIMHAIKAHAKRMQIPRDEIPRGMGYAAKQPGQRRMGNVGETN
jgi:chromosomal replication initiation ATPase DnaA